MAADISAHVHADCDEFLAFFIGMKRHAKRQQRLRSRRFSRLRSICQQRRDAKMQRLDRQRGVAHRERQRYFLAAIFQRLIQPIHQITARRHQFRVRRQMRRIECQAQPRFPKMRRQFRR